MQASRGQNLGKSLFKSEVVNFSTKFIVQMTDTLQSFVCVHFLRIYVRRNDCRGASDQIESRASNRIL